MDSVPSFGKAFMARVREALPLGAIICGGIAAVVTLLAIVTMRRSGPKAVEGTNNRILNCGAGEPDWRLPELRGGTTNGQFPAKNSVAN